MVDGICGEIQLETSMAELVGRNFDLNYRLCSKGDEACGARAAEKFVARLADFSDNGAQFSRRLYFNPDKSTEQMALERTMRR